MLYLLGELDKQQSHCENEKLHVEYRKMASCLAL